MHIVILMCYQFVLQEDFMLSASREDILQDNEWNESVILAAVDLFVQTAELFNEQGLMKYTWLQYLQSQSSVHGIASNNFRDRLLDHLRHEAVLESQALIMELPTNLKCVPDIFTDGTSSAVPLLDGPEGQRSWTAAAYSANNLKKLEVKELMAKDFMNMLRTYITYHNEGFRQHPAAWHSQLSKAISYTGPSLVRDLTIVSLRGDRWTSAAGTKLYFPGISDGLVLPTGIQVQIIEDDAAKDPLRCDLFTKFGASHLNPSEVLQIILDEHSKHGNSYITWTVETVVSHAWFLFNSPSKPSEYDLSKLRLASRNATLLHRGPELYMDAPGSNFRLSD